MLSKNREAVIIKNNENKLIKYTVASMAVFIILICLNAAYFVWSAKKDLYTEKVQYLTEISLKSADLIKTKVNDRLGSLEMISAFIGEHETFNTNYYISILRDEMYKNEFKQMGIISLEGLAVTTDGHTYDFSNSKHFKKALAGESNVSDLIVDETDGIEINIFATPIKYNGKIISVLFATEKVDEFSKMLSIKSFGNEGYSYLIKEDGTPVIHTTHKNSIGRYSNLFDALKSVTSNKNIAEKFKINLQNEKDSFFIYERDGIKRHVSYTKVGVNDWYIISVVPTSVISNTSDKLIVGIVATASLIVLLALILSYVLVRFFKKNNRKLKAIAFTDVVTGYSNWNKFEIDCADLLRHKLDRRYAMINFDIDKFKVINDIYGHKRGNDVLQYIANVLMQSTNELETFSRISSDNFNILMCYETNDDIIARINAINKQVVASIEGYTMKLYFGIYEIGNNISNISALSDRANLAKLSIKGQSDNTFSFFDEEIRKSILIENEIENCMEFALKDHEFEIYLQPKFLFETEEIVGAEALVRWNRPGKGVVAPNSFIPLFEKNGFVRKLDKYMFEQVCILLGKWAKANEIVTPIAISVNFSRMDLSNTMLPKDLLNIAKRHGVNPEWVEIEITESAVFDDTNRLIEVMQDLKNAGFIISIDDFGSGYSSLNVLKDLPANVIKMDKEFLNEATNNERGRRIVSSLIQMSKGLGLCTVAEGVETVGQVSFLKEAGCDIAQGYYYAKPMPVKDFEELFNHQKCECLIC